MLCWRYWDEPEGPNSQGPDNLVKEAGRYHFLCGEATIPAHMRLTPCLVSFELAQSKELPELYPFTY